MRAILVGAVESTLVALEAIHRNTDFDLALVLSLSHDKASRHSDFVDLRAAAEANSVPFTAIENINRPEAIESIRAAAADYLFIIGWSQICGDDVMSAMPDRIIGYHPAALPRMRGRAAIPWTILQQEPITAGSLFWMDSGVDTGATLDQEYFHVAEDETASSLYQRHMEALAVMLDRTLPVLASGDSPRRDQEERHATYAARRTAKDGLIDWLQNASEIERLVRAVGKPYPGAYAVLHNTKLIIWSAELSSIGSRHAAVPGQIIQLDIEKNLLVVACGDNTALKITNWEFQSSSIIRLHAKLGDKL